MSKTHYLLFAASAFALSACFGSSSGTTSLEMPNDTPLEAMPTSGSATYSGAMTGIRGDGNMSFEGNMSMTANFAEGGGTITDANLTIDGATGAFTQDGAHPFMGNEYENLEMGGSIVVDGNTIASNPGNRLLVGGTFSGDAAGSVSANLGGAVETPEGRMSVTGGRGVLTAQPAP